MLIIYLQTSLIANEGAQLNLSAVTTVASVSHLTEFTSYLLTEPSFTWQIYGESLEVVALGITVDLITISKEVRHIRSRTARR